MRVSFFMLLARQEQWGLKPGVVMGTTQRCGCSVGGAGQYQGTLKET
jgi:hypothetical protein